MLSDKGEGGCSVNTSRGGRRSARSLVHGFDETGDVRVPSGAVPGAAGELWGGAGARGAGTASRAAAPAAEALAAAAGACCSGGCGRGAGRCAGLSGPLDFPACGVTLGPLRGDSKTSGLALLPAWALVLPEALALFWLWRFPRQRVSIAVTAVRVDRRATLLMTPAPGRGPEPPAPQKPPTVTGVTAECVQAEKKDQEEQPMRSKTKRQL